jgi:ParB-like chromosome segregation protein Spo0J
MPKPKKSERRLETRRSQDLSPHPLQNQLLADLNEHEFQTLVDDIERNGQLQEIEITVDDVIIDGHQRVRAALALGLDEVLVWVRDDLQDEEAIEQRFIEANFNRRQLSKLDQARCYRRWRQIERCRDDVKGDLRDFVAERFGVSGRTLDRWDRLLNTPIEVQRAWEADKLTLAVAGRVADLSAAKQSKISNAIRKGGDPKKVIAKYSKPKPTQPKSMGTLVQRFFRSVDSGLDDLNGNEEAVKRTLDSDDLPLLRRANKFFVGLIRHIKEHPEECLSFEERLASLDVPPGQSDQPETGA